MIRLHHINVQYGSSRGSTEALRDIDLEIDREFLGLIGPTGCGKTTLLRVLAGLIPPTAGTLDFNGSEDPAYGIVFQDYSLLPWLTARKNIELGLKIEGASEADRKAASDHFLQALNLDDAAHLLPHELSGGMRQRVAIARAFAPDPPLLLMDEPFGALDAITREDLQDALARLYESAPKTVVFVTHDVEEALLLCDRICVLTARPGRVNTIVQVPFGRPRDHELKRDPRFSALKTEIEDLLRTTTPRPLAPVVRV
jgi:NitT/TauT family transport system ATP-binding protein